MSANLLILLLLCICLSDRYQYWSELSRVFINVSGVVFSCDKNTKTLNLQFVGILPII